MLMGDMYEYLDKPVHCQSCTNIKFHYVNVALWHEWAQIHREFERVWWQFVNAFLPWHLPELLLLVQSRAANQYKGYQQVRVVHHLWFYHSRAVWYLNIPGTHPICNNSHSMSWWMGQPIVQLAMGVLCNHLMSCLLYLSLVDWARHGETWWCCRAHSWWAIRLTSDSTTRCWDSRTTEQPRSE